jgi:2-polyprenyl-6-methoxyphenol hydroxylase-like FAD-dependent oxidoreductase
VRALAFGEETRFIHHLGYQVGACSAPGELGLPSKAGYLYNRPNKLAMLFPLRPGEVMFYLVHRTDETNWIPPAERLARLRTVFSDMGWVIPRLLDAVDDHSPVFMDTVSQIQMPQWSRGRIALVGDACQCLTLLAGQGASMAAAGAYRLAGELKRANGDFTAAFARYEAKQKPGILARQREARRMSRWFFVPRTRLGITVRNWALRLFSLPFLFNKVFLPTLTTDDRLEPYEREGAPLAAPLSRSGAQRRNRA